MTWLLLCTKIYQEEQQIFEQQGLHKQNHNKLDEIIDKYENTYHRAIKMMPTNVHSGIFMVLSITAKTQI